MSVEPADPEALMKHAQVLVVKLELLCNRDGLFFPPTLPSYTYNRLYTEQGDAIKNLVLCRMPAPPEFYTPLKLFAGQTYDIVVNDPLKDALLGKYRIETECWFPKNMRANGHKLWSWNLRMETTFEVDADRNIKVLGTRSLPFE